MKRLKDYAKRLEVHEEKFRSNCYSYIIYKVEQPELMFNQEIELNKNYKTSLTTLLIVSRFHRYFMMEVIGIYGRMKSFLKEACKEYNI